MMGKDEDQIIQQHLASEAERAAARDDPRGERDGMGGGGDNIYFLTRDDGERLRSIAGEMEHLPAEFRRFFDQDGRDARYLRKLSERILGGQG